MELLVDDPATLALIQTGKGWIFVVVTAFWLYILVRREYRLRYQVEEVERATSEVLDAFIGSAPIAIVGLDRSERVIHWNRAAELLFGWSAEEVLGQGVPFVPLDRGEESKRIHDRLLEGERLEGIELVRHHRDGSPLDIAIWTAPLRSRSGSISGTVVAISDISSLRSAQAEIRRQLERISSLRRVDQTITASLDLDLTLGVVLEEVVAQLGVDAASVLLLNLHSQLLEPARALGFSEPPRPGAPLGRPGEGVAGLAVLERRTIHLGTIEESGIQGRRTEWFESEGFVTHIATPLLIKGQVRGVLEVFSRSVLDPAPEWFEFLETLAGQTALAIDNTSLFEELQRANARLTIAYDATLEGWSGALDLRDEETEGHSRRVAEASVLLASELGIDGEELVHLRRGALLHDIGKMGIPDSILLKAGPLTAEEWAVMRRHPVYAYELLSPIDFLRPALDIPYCHHERWDGTGYPRGLKGEEIPIAARIFAVVDVWDALLSDRPYRKRREPAEALSYIESEAGRHFDPEVVSEFLRLDDRLQDLRLNCAYLDGQLT